MGKSSTRRKRRRPARLGALAVKNPRKFKSQWAKFLESKCEEVSRCAKILTDRNGNPAPEAFAVVDEVLNELVACGPEAVELAYDETKEIMTDFCCRVVAASVDRRLYRLSNGRSNQHRMEVGTHNPPR